MSNPLDATRFLDTPCDLITGQQAGDIGLPFAGEERSTGSVTCIWRANQNAVGVADNVAFLVADGDLDAIQKGATEGNAAGPRCDRADRAATMVIQRLKGGR